MPPRGPHLPWFQWPSCSWTFHSPRIGPASHLHWLLVCHSSPADQSLTTLLPSRVLHSFIHLLFLWVLILSVIRILYFQPRSFEAINPEIIFPMWCNSKQNHYWAIKISWRSLTKFLRFPWCWCLLGKIINLFIFQKNFFNFWYSNFAAALIFVILEDSPTLFLTLCICCSYTGMTFLPSLCPSHPCPKQRRKWMELVRHLM